VGSKIDSVRGPAAEGAALSAASTAAGPASSSSSSSSTAGAGEAWGATVASGALDGNMVRAGGLKGLRLKPAPAARRRGSSSDSDSSSSSSSSGGSVKKRERAAAAAAAGVRPKGPSKYVGLLKRPVDMEPGIPSGASFREGGANAPGSGGGGSAAASAAASAADLVGAAKALQTGAMDAEFSRADALKGLRLKPVGGDGAGAGAGAGAAARRRRSVASAVSSHGSRESSKGPARPPRRTRGASNASSEAGGGKKGGEEDAITGLSDGDGGDDDDDDDDDEEDDGEDGDEFGDFLAESDGDGDGKEDGGGAGDALRRGASDGSRMAALGSTRSLGNRTGSSLSAAAAAAAGVRGGGGLTPSGADDGSTPVSAASGSASGGGAATVPVSTAELFETDTFFEVDKEWEHLKTLKLVFTKAGLDASAQRRFLEALRPATFSPGAYIVRQGEVGDMFYIISEGEVVVTRTLDASNKDAAAAGLLPLDAGELVITHLYEGHFFGETSIVTEQPRNANVRVAHGSSAVRCMCMSKAAFTPFLQEDEKFRTLISELVRKKEETARVRAEMLATQGGTGTTTEVARNEVKVTRLAKKGKTSNGKTIINGYVLMQKLGAGSYGTVWLAQSIAHSKKYAIKIVSRALLRRKRFGSAAQSDEDVLREVAVMKRLQHRNVVALYEVIDDSDGDKFYMVQEYMELGPVMTEREYNHPLHPSVALEYVRDLVAGLEYLHFQGVVHRDIKPSNILIASDGTAKLADFGASAITRDGTDLLTEVKGTPAFQPPEVFTLEGAAKYHGFAADIWALGATLHTMVVGIPPYMADNEFELVEKLKHEEFRLAATVQLDPHLRNLLLRCLTKDPEKRITLSAILTHDWVTEEGSRPLVSRAYAKLNLASTTVAPGGPFSPLVSPDGALLSPTATAETPSPVVAATTTTAAAAAAAASGGPAGGGAAALPKPSGPLPSGGRGSAAPAAAHAPSSASAVPAADHGAAAHVAPAGGPKPSTVAPSPAAVAPAPSSGAAGRTSSPLRSRMSPLASGSSATLVRSYTARGVGGPGGGGAAAGPAAVNADQTDDQKAHLRALRLRQHNLLRGHTNLTERERDLLSDQKRIAFHADRAVASVEELYMDATGTISERPTDGSTLGGSMGSSAHLSGVSSAHTFHSGTPGTWQATKALGRAGSNPSMAGKGVRSGGGAGTAASLGAPDLVGGVDGVLDGSSTPASSKYSTAQTISTVGSTVVLRTQTNTSSGGAGTGTGVGATASSAHTILTTSLSPDSSTHDMHDGGSIPGLIRTRSRTRNEDAGAGNVARGAGSQHAAAASSSDDGFAHVSDGESDDDDEDVTRVRSSGGTAAASSGSADGSSSSLGRTMSRAASTQRITGGLNRKEDFLMVTANVDAAEGGGTLVRKVIFRARGADGSLSITGGRSHARPGDGGKATKKSARSLGKLDALAEASSSRERRSGGGKTGGDDDDDDVNEVKTSDGSSDGLGGGDDDDDDLESDAGSESSDEAEYEGVTSIADLAGGPGGTSAAVVDANLDKLLAGLSSTAPPSSATDPEVAALSPEHEAVFVAQRAKGLVYTFADGKVLAPEDVAAVQDAAQRAEEEAAAQGAAARGSLAHSKGKGKPAVSAVDDDDEDDEDDDEDDGDADGDVSEASSLGDDDLGLDTAGGKASGKAGAGGGKSSSGGRGAKSGAGANAPPQLAPEKGTEGPLPLPPTWDAGVHVGRFVSCPVGSNAHVGLVYGSAEVCGRRATMEDRTVAIPSLAATLAQAGPDIGAAPASILTGPPGAHPDYAFFAVYDGHNGAATSETLSQAFHFRLSARLGLVKGTDEGEPDPPLCVDHASAFVDASLELDTELQKEVVPGEPISGSTAIMLLLRGAGPAGPAGGRATLTVANVGDSRAVLSARGGAVVDLSIDHKCSRPDERARIEAAGGQVIKDRLHGVLAVSRAFGDAEHKRMRGAEMWGREFLADPLTAEPEVVERDVEDDDEFVVLACDGVWDVMSSTQVVNFVRRRLLVHRDVRRAAKELVDKALALNSIDNISVIVVGLQTAFGK
jgi:serine/threonine protein kinase/serine/threonine protein phosphatase PrpC